MPSEALFKKKVRRLRALRFAAGDMKQYELAARAGISQASVCAAERGFSSPRILQAIAEGLGFRGDPASLLDFVRVPTDFEDC